jgi:PAS domain S-box-containing protein
MHAVPVPAVKPTHVGDGIVAMSQGEALSESAKSESAKSERATFERATFEIIVGAAPIALLGVDQGGVIRYVNRLAEHLFRYDRDELIGQPVEALMPASFREAHREHRASHFEASVARSMGTFRELTGRRRDGSEFTAGISLSSAVETGDGLLVIAAVRDVSAGKQDYQNLERLAAIIENSDDAIIGKTLDGIITSWNPAAARMYGYSAEEIIGRSATMLGGEDRSQEQAAILDKVRNGEGTQHYDTIRVRKDGTEFPVVLTVSPIHDAWGMLIGSYAIVRDMAKQRQALDDARSMIEASLDSLVAISALGMITDVNEATVEATGVPREQLIGTAFSDYFTEPDKADAVYHLVFAEGMARDYPLTIRHRDGRLTEVLYNASVYRDPGGKVLGVFAAARDVTKQMQAFDDARSMIEASLDSLVSISPEGLITDVNEATITATGVPRWELIGTAFSDCFTEPDKAEAVFQLVFAEGMARDYPLTIRHRDGRLTEVLYNASVYSDTRGKVLGVFAAARDVTKQRQAQAEIADQLGREMERRAELEKFQRLTVGRELKMVELKKEIESLRRYAGTDVSEPGLGF